MAHLPIALKLFLARVICAKLADIYVSAEKAIISQASEYETELLEPLLLSRLKADA